MNKLYIARVLNRQLYEPVKPQAMLRLTFWGREFLRRYGAPHAGGGRGPGLR